MTDEKMHETERRYQMTISVPLSTMVRLESADGQIVTVRADAERIISRMIHVGYVIVPAEITRADESKSSNVERTC